MRIAEAAPLAESVPPRLYGGTERVVSWLTDALLDLNCSVTLFASGDSKTRARLIAVCPQALRLSKPPIDPAVATSALIDAVATRADEFDLIHWHTDWLHLPLARYLKTPLPHDVARPFGPAVHEPHCFKAWGTAHSSPFPIVNEVRCRSSIGQQLSIMDYLRPCCPIAQTRAGIWPS